MTEQVKITIFDALIKPFCVLTPQWMARTVIIYLRLRFAGSLILRYSLNEIST